MTISLIVPAAGCGARVGLGANKILAPLGRRPLLWHTIQALTGVDYAPHQPLELIIAAQRTEFELIEEAVGETALPLRLVEGGATRQDSVEAAVKAATGDLVLVHDAARPCVEPQYVTATCQAAAETGAAILAVAASDTVKRAHSTPQGLQIAETIPRETVYLAQTPQVFRRALLLSALERARAEGFAGTDCASLVERGGHPVSLVAGSPRNLKVTYAEDLARAEALLRQN